jgi:oligopeptide/dipeptide ABC transporter ATP-binding protein
MSKDNINNENLLELKDIKKYFFIRRGLFYKIISEIKAVDGVDLSIRFNETLALVGESGCGKTTLGRIILGFIQPDSGNIYFKQNNLKDLPFKRIKELQKKIQIVFQDPFNSLDPRFRIRDTLKEGLSALKKWSREELDNRISELLRQVELDPSLMDRFPYEFSGGERQRIAIARAISVNPQLIVLDEAVSSLDVLVQRKILELLIKLKEELQISYLFISHNLRVVRQFSQRVAVMYLGKIVEIARSEDIFNSNLDSLHPYTEALILASIKKEARLKGEPESLTSIPSGCRFHTRCKYAKDICKNRTPYLEPKKKGHFIACHFR